MISFAKTLALLTGFCILITATVYAQETVCKCSIPIDGSFLVAPMTQGQNSIVGVPPLYESNNATTPALALPFEFCFYGHDYDSVYISDNGIVSFTKPIYRFIDSTETFPLGGDTAIVAPFYAAATTLANSGIVYYKITPTYMVVVWDSVRYLGNDVDGWNICQLIISNGADPILPQGNNVGFCYPQMQWACSDSSGGFSGYNGTPAFAGINEGDGYHYTQLGRFALPGDVYDGPFSPYNGVEWLDFQSFTLNTCVRGDNIGPIIADNFPHDDTIYVCPCDTLSTESALGASDSSQTQSCDTLNLLATFICGGVGQTAALSYSLTGPLNISSVYISTSGYIDSILVQAIPTFGDTGIQQLSLIADDTVNFLRSVVVYTIDVTTQCLTAGITQISSSSGFAVYPNPASGILSLSCSDLSGNTVAKISDMLGADVISTGIKDMQSDIDVSGLARGLYFVTLYKDGNPVGVKKVILM